MKHTVFISHANPENNYFTAWLASKLRLLGYKVWADVDDIKPGQYFNRDFEKVIRENTVIFLSVVSKDYLAKSMKDDTGVMNEILCARTIKDIDGFIVPLHYDDCSFSDFSVGLRGRLTIDFRNNWADGLRDLVKHLEDLSVPKFSNSENITKFWHEAQKIASEPLNKTERYLTNWFPINLPTEIYVHQPEILLEKDFATMPYNYIREGDRIITFSSKETISNYTRVKSSFSYSVEEFYSNDTMTIDNKFALHEPNKKLIKLLNKTFRSLLIRQHLRRYEQANKKEVFYFPYSYENKKMVNLKSVGRNRRSVIGIKNNFTWHFAVSHAASTFPSPNFKIFYHIVFTDFDGKTLPSTEQHELRRSMPSDWYNRKWLETLLAMMFKISNEDPSGLIHIKIDNDRFMTVNVLPIEVESPVGYREPQKDEA